MKRLSIAAVSAAMIMGAAASAPGVAWSQSGAADSGSAPAADTRLTPEQAAAFSKQIETDLAAKGARLAIVFRTGRPHNKMPRGISYTHGAFWVYRTIHTQDGRDLPGYAVYNLFQGDGKTLPVTQSYLAQDWPFDFVRGSAVDDVAIIIPSPEMQRRIVAVMDSPTYARLHNPSYSLIANPLSSKHQNCNGFMLDVIASAAWDTTDPAQIRADEKAHFHPSVIEAGPVKRLLAPLADPRIKTDDQSHTLVTATYESMSAFMKDNGLLQASYILNRAP
jgi:hypothetical protein